MGPSKYWNGFTLLFKTLQDDMILIGDFEVAPSMSDAVSFGMPKYSSSIFFI
jgi:hypothetical protein